MKILIIDRDDVAAQFAKSKMEPLGHEIKYEPSKNEALKTLSASPFDIICVDPSPLTDARQMVLNIRRAVGYYPYMLLLSETLGQSDAVKSGMNDVLQKPFDVARLDQSIQNARMLMGLVRRIGDGAEDFPSAGGVIAKSAFNQLFLSGIDRAGRYAERTYILFIAMNNYGDVRNLDGQYAADYAVAKLSQFLVLQRRQSDIIGQTANNEFALLLQRPNFDSEPIEAAKRFAEAIEGNAALKLENGAPIEVSVRLVELPMGSTLVNYTLTPGQEKPVSV